MRVQFWVGLGILFLTYSSISHASEPVQSDKISKGAIKLVKKVAPIYPAEAKKEKISGKVMLDVTINEEGKVAAVKVKESSHPALEKAAVDAVKQWEYAPMRINDKPVAVITTITLNFALDQNPEKPVPAK